jgi:DNA-nicking Smr family endonuclease
MNAPKRNGFHRPFEALSKALKQRRRRLRDTDPSAHRPPEKPAPAPAPALSIEEERRLFLDAMHDVMPIENHRHAPLSAAKPGSQGKPQKISPSEEAVLDALNDLVQGGKGFIVEQTAEYIEGRQEWIPADITRRLHAGQFSVQSYIDLHGMRPHAAAAAVDTFLKESLRRGWRVILVVHGRGLSSPGRPVLKREVVRWLTSGKWRKWVLAFTSAPHHDGGAGGTYVLMGKRPIPKRRRRLTIHRNG